MKRKSNRLPVGTKRQKLLDEKGKKSLAKLPKKEVPVEVKTFFMFLISDLRDELAKYLNPAERYILTFLQEFANRGTYQTQPCQRRLVIQAIKTQSPDLLSWALLHEQDLSGSMFNVFYADAVHSSTKSRPSKYILDYLKTRYRVHNIKLVLNSVAILSEIFRVDGPDLFLLRHANDIGMLRPYRSRLCKKLLRVLSHQGCKNNEALCVCRSEPLGSERAESEFLPFFTYFVSENIPIGQYEICDVARAGKAQILEYLKNLIEPGYIGFPEACARKDSVDCLKIVLDRGCELTSDFIIASIRNNAVECLKHVFLPETIEKYERCPTPDYSEIDCCLEDMADNCYQDDGEEYIPSVETSLKKEIFLFVIGLGYKPSHDVFTLYEQWFLELSIDKLCDTAIGDRAIQFCLFKHAAKTKNGELFERLKLLMEID